jgi:Flp pilus assembly protein TadG
MTRPDEALPKARGDGGTAAAEFAVVFPLLLLVLVGVVFVGRLATAEGQVEGAARDAARAASARRSPANAGQAARVEAEAALRAGGVTCQRLDVRIDTSRFEPGGSVAVSVTCQVSLAGLDLLGLPGSTTRTATARAPIDLYRSTG